MPRRYFELIQYPEIQVSGGTIDRTSYKSIYLQIRGHLFADNEYGPQELKHFFWGIKQTINKALDYSICDKKFISELEFSETFKKKTYTYFIMDFTFFPNDRYELTTYEYFLNEITKNIWRNNITTSPFQIIRHKKDVVRENKDINSIRTSH
jgi:hypothetical protein